MTTLGTKIYEKLKAKSLITNDLSINDIREMDFDGKRISTEQRQALHNFDRYRIRVLSRQESEKKFHKKYLELQVMANLSPYQEFLKDKYAKV